LRQIETIVRHSLGRRCGLYVTAAAASIMVLGTVAFQLAEAREGAPSPLSKLALATAATDWSLEDIDIFDSALHDRNGCEFFSAAQKRLMDAATVELVKLPDGTVVSNAGRRDNHVAATILQTCGTNATATWWAEIVVRFGSQILGHLVHGEADGFAVREIERRGATFHLPALDTSKGTIGLSFYAILYEPVQPLWVVAKLSPEGRLDVLSKPVD